MNKSKAPLINSLPINYDRELLIQSDATGDLKSNSSVYESSHSASRKRNISLIITSAVIILIMCFMLLIARNQL